MWNYYLSYCEGGFRSRNIDVGQFLIKKNYYTLENEIFILFFTGVCIAIPTFPVMVFLPALYSEVYRIGNSHNWNYTFAAKLIDITTDPLMGWVNDKNFFSRKIWLIIGGLLSGLLFINFLR